MIFPEWGNTVPWISFSQIGSSCVGGQFQQIGQKLDEMAKSKLWGQKNAVGMGGGQTNFSGSQRDQSLLPPSPPPTMGGPVDKDRSENHTLV